MPHAPSQARALIVTADGSVLFGADNGVPGEPRRYVLAIEKITPQGTIGLVVDHKSAEGFAGTADGSIWFTGTRRVGRIFPSGEIAEFPLPGGEPSAEISFAEGPIVAGADGNLWFSGSRSSTAGSETRIVPVATIDRITQAGEITEFALPGVGGYPTELAAGPDGNVWFTAWPEDKVGRITPEGQITEFSVPTYFHPGAITAGPDGSLWFAEEMNPLPAIGRITPAGELSQLLLPSEQPPWALNSGPDGRLWFVYEDGAIGRLAPSGRLSLVELPDRTGVEKIASGPEGDVWYTAAPEPPCPSWIEGCANALPTAPAIVGRIEPGPLAAEIAAGGLLVRNGRTMVTISCIDGTAAGVCRGRLSLRAGGGSRPPRL